MAVTPTTIGVPGSTAAAEWLTTDFWHWFTTPDPAGEARKEELIKHGAGLYETWTKLAYQPPPSDFFGRILWTFGVIGQMIISIFTFPAALGAFLMEESVQSAGMGAYMLASAREYDMLQQYLAVYRDMLNTAEIATKTLAGLSPVTGGAALIYMDAARMSEGAFEYLAAKGIEKQIATDEKARAKELDKINYGSLRIQSSPSNAEIWINNVNTDTLTPETFTKLEEGKYFIALAKWSAKLEAYDTYTFSQEIRAGKKYEILIRIPPGAATETTNQADKTGTEAPRLPDFVAAIVTVAKIIDGDTFETTTGERIRILGMDAPEIGRPFADLATELLTAKIDNKKVDLSIPTARPTDTYGRTLAVVRYRDENVAVTIIASGLAKYFESADTPLDPTKYMAAEAVAKERRIGIWSELK